MLGTPPAQAAQSYPSIKKKSIINDIKEEFREGRLVTAPEEACSGTRTALGQQVRAQQ